MGRGPKKHQKRLSAPSHWLLDKLSGAYAPKASPGPHKLRDCMPLIVFIRNRYEHMGCGRYWLVMEEVLTELHPTD